MNTAKQTSEAIFEALGNSKFLAMTGAREFMSGETYLSFKIPRCNKINRVKIELCADDTYTVTFFDLNMRSCTLLKRAEVKTVYVNQLKQVFTEHTGLVVSL